MFSTNEELETTIDCLINKIWELRNMLKVSRNKAKSFEEQIERYKNETRKLDDLEAKNYALSKDIKILNNKIENLESENNNFLKENKVLKEKIKELEEKVKTKKEVKEIMEKLSKFKE